MGTNASTYIDTLRQVLLDYSTHVWNVVSEQSSHTNVHGLYIPVGAWPVPWARMAAVGTWPVPWAPCGRRGGVAGPLGPVWPPWIIASASVSFS